MECHQKRATQVNKIGKRSSVPIKRSVRRRSYSRRSQYYDAIPSAVEVSQIDTLYLKKQQKLGEEGPDMLPDLIPKSFTEETAR